MERRNKKQIKIHAKPNTVGFRCNCSNNSGKHAVIPVFVYKHTFNEQKDERNFKQTNNFMA